VSPRKRIEPGTQAAFGDLAPRPRRRPGLAVLVAAATVLVIAAVAVSAAVLVTHQRRYDAAVRDVAVLGFVRTFMTHYTSPDPFHANDYADAVLAQSTGQLADMYKKRMNEIVVQVARAEPTQGTVLDAGIERWNDDGTANVVVAAETTTTLPDGKKIENENRWLATAVQEGDQWKISNLMQVI